MRFYKFLVLFGMLVTLSVTFCKAKTCSRVKTSYDANGGTTDVLLYFCCSDYVLLHGNCTKCPKGFRVGSDERKCDPCLPRNFGLDCASDCKCNSLERCDNVYGCISKDIKECEPGFRVDGDDCVECDPGFYGVKCILECDCYEDEWCNSTVGCVKIEELEWTSDVNSKVISVTNPGVSSTQDQARRTTTRQESNTRADQADTTSWPSMYIWVIVISGSVVIVVLIILSSIHIFTKVKSVPITGQAEHSQGSEHPYDEVDENNLAENILLISSTPAVPPQRNRCSNENTNTGYLEPISRTRTVSETGVTEKQVSKKTRISGYLQPYQPLKRQCTVHKYHSTIATVQKQNSSDKSENLLEQNQSVHDGKACKSHGNPSGYEGFVNGERGRGSCGDKSGGKDGNLSGYSVCLNGGARGSYGDKSGGKDGNLSGYSVCLNGGARGSCGDKSGGKDGNLSGYSVCLNGGARGSYGDKSGGKDGNLSGYSVCLNGGARGSCGDKSGGKDGNLSGYSVCLNGGARGSCGDKTGGKDGNLSGYSVCLNGGARGSCGDRSVCEDGDSTGYSDGGDSVSGTGDNDIKGDENGEVDCSWGGDIDAFNGEGIDNDIMGVCGDANVEVGCSWGGDIDDLTGEGIDNDNNENNTIHRLQEEQGHA